MYLVHVTTTMAVEIMPRYKNSKLYIVINMSQVAFKMTKNGCLAVA